MGRAAIAVRTDLMQAISGQYRPGERLPSEPDLAAAYEVSRSTLREALQSLETDGVVRRIHGLGTFVNHVVSPVAGALEVDLGVTETVEAANQRLGVQILRIEEGAAPRRIAERLSLPPAGRILRIERLIMANDRAAVLALDAIPHTIVAAAPARYVDGSVYRYLERVCGLRLHGGLAHLSAIAADAAMARLLDVPAGSALLRLEQVERTTADDAVLYSLEHYVPERFELTVSRRRGGARR